MALSAELRAMHKIMKTLEDLYVEEGATVRRRVEVWLAAKLAEDGTPLVTSAPRGEK